MSHASLPMGGVLRALKHPVTQQKLKSTQCASAGEEPNVVPPRQENVEEYKSLP